MSQQTRDYDSTLARIAGNIAAGLAEQGRDQFDHEVATRSVKLAELIVAACKLKKAQGD